MECGAAGMSQLVLFGGLCFQNESSAIARCLCWLKPFARASRSFVRSIDNTLLPYMHYIECVCMCVYVCTGMHVSCVCVCVCVCVRVRICVVDLCSK